MGVERVVEAEKWMRNGLRAKAKVAPEEIVYAISSVRLAYKILEIRDTAVAPRPKSDRHLETL